MPPLPARILIVCVLSFACAVSLQAQDSVAPPPTATALKLDYPDSIAELEHLVKDIIKAQKENAGDRADTAAKPRSSSAAPGMTWPLGLRSRKSPNQSMSRPVRAFQSRLTPRST
jgi:hypothetical protein